MLVLIALLLLDEPKKGFTVTRESVQIEKLGWLDAQGRKRETEGPYLQIRLKLVNDADHAIRWPGFGKARVTYGQRLRSAVLQQKPFEEGARWEDSLVADTEVRPGEQRSILLVFPVPRERGRANLELQWHGESQGVRITIKQGFQLPADK